MPITTAQKFWLGENDQDGSWGTDIRAMRASSPADIDTTKADFGTSGGAKTITFDPLTTRSTTGIVDIFGWAWNSLAASGDSLGSVAGAKRFYRAGDYTLSYELWTTLATGTTCTLTRRVYRVGADGTRVQVGAFTTGSISVGNSLSPTTYTTTVAVGEYIVEAGETILLVLACNSSSNALGNTITLRLGADTFEEIPSPGWLTLADTTGSASGSGVATGESGKVLATIGASIGEGSATGEMSSRADAIGSAAGVGAGSAQASSIAGTVGSSTGVGTGSGLTSIVLGGIGSVVIGAGDTDPGAGTGRVITGTVFDGAVGYEGAVVVLFRRSDNKPLLTTTSAVDGSYSFDRDAADTAEYYVAAWDETGTRRQDVTERTLTSV